ncbi:MAG: hypothetical protein ACTHKS_11000 [Gaiellaceae bacterium]
MKLWPLLCGGLLLVGAFDLARALATHSGVGPVEYAAGGILVALATVAGVQVGRRGLHIR